MSGDKETDNENTASGEDKRSDTEANETNLRRTAGAKGLKQRELPSDLSSVRSVKTFIKPSAKPPQTEKPEPIPWPMPPKLQEKQSEVEPKTAASPKREADKDFLTPQSSFAQHNRDSSAQVPILRSSELGREGSGTYSTESSVKRESFSSVETGVSLAFADSGESGSSESVSKVDIDADEFARFLSQKTKSSHSAVDFSQLFAEESHERKIAESNCKSPPTEEGHLSGFPENSTTPKAIRAPFRYRKSTKSISNTVSLEEALEFSPDYKTLGTKTGPPVYDEVNVSEGNGSKGLPNDVGEDIHYELSAESGLRRPMGSKRRNVVVLPPQKEDTPCRENSSEEASGKETSTEPESNNGKEIEEGQSCDTVEATPPVKGVIMRAQTHVSHVAGIRRAETGRIMSRAELRMQKPILFQDSPNPKSLNPAGFPNEEDDVTTAHASTLFPDSSSDSDKAINEQPSNSKVYTPAKQSSTNKKLTRTPKSGKVDDGSFLSPGILSRKKKYGTEEYRIDSFQFSEHEGSSSGLLNRFSSGFRKVHNAVAKKSSHEVTEAAESAIVVSGTIDEAVCKICVVCRKQLEYDVYVKDTGKKIKVESRKEGKSRHLRATILVRKMPGETSSCEVFIRQSRSDGMKTSLATLWNFHQRLAAGLKEMG